MKPKAYYLVFDGLADWEAALALAEINKSGKFEIVTVGLSGEAVVTMGGVRILPDLPLESVSAGSGTAIFMMPGGEMWEKGSNEKVIALLHRLKAAGVPIAAICGATVEIARAGLTHGTRHTSNAPDYLKELADGYADQDLYVDEPAVADRQLITASGLGSVEFAREIIRKLGIYDEDDIKIWFEMFKYGTYAK